MENQRDAPLHFTAEGPLSAPTVLFVHGFPDNGTLWDRQVKGLKDTYRCICVDLPGYGEGTPESPPPDFPETVQRLVATLEAAGVAAEEAVHLVCHDWGAAYGYLFAEAHPAKVASLVCVDVGARIGSQPSPLGYALVPLYQWALAGAWLLGGQTTGAAAETSGVRSKLARGLVTGVMGALGALNDPAQKLSVGVRARRVEPRHCYPYAQFWKHLLRRTGQVRMRTPRVPFLYIYGKAGLKRFMMFQDSQWLKHLENSASARVVCLEQAGHWVMRDEPERFNEAVRTFFANPPTRPAPG